MAGESEADIDEKILASLEEPGGDEEIIVVEADAPDAGAAPAGAPLETPGEAAGAPADAAGGTGSPAPAEGAGDLSPAAQRLQQQLDNERRARAQAEADLARERASSHTAQQAALESQISMVSASLETVQRDAENAQADYVRAAQAGDYEGMAKAQRIMSKAEVRIAQLEGAKLELQQYQAGRRQISEGRVTAQPSSDPVETAITQGRLSPASADWVRRHPEYVTDPDKYRKLQAAHNVAVLNDIQGDTPEYFAAVESALGITKSASPTPTPAPATTQPSPVGRVAAPASRSAPTVKPQGQQQTVTLTAEERDIAKSMGMTAQEYAREKLAIARERSGTKH